MRKIKHSFIYLLLVGFLFSACSNQEKQVKIGFSLGPDHDRWQKDKEFFINKVESMGGKVYFEEAMGNTDKQVEQVKQLLKNKIQVLVIVPENSSSAAKIVDMAHEAGVKVIAYDRIIKNCDLDFYISFDNIKVGELQAEYLSKLCPVGKYAILGGDPNDHNSTLLKIGQKNVLQPLVEKGDVDIVLEQSILSWDKNIAYKLIDDYLSKGNELEAIIASNDQLATGAFDALKKHGLEGKVLLSGQDADIEACQRIAKGHQTMTVYKIIESLATAAANSSVSIARGKETLNTQLTLNNGKVMVNSLLLPSMYTVHRENIRMTVVADGFIDEGKIFQ